MSIEVGGSRKRRRFEEEQQRVGGSVFKRQRTVPAFHASQGDRTSVRDGLTRGVALPPSTRGLPRPRLVYMLESPFKVAFESSFPATHDRGFTECNAGGDGQAVLGGLSAGDRVKAEPRESSVLGALQALALHPQTVPARQDET